jgi:hypothetical protein
MSLGSACHDAGIGAGGQGGAGAALTLDLDDEHDARPGLGSPLPTHASFRFGPDASPTAAAPAPAAPEARSRPASASFGAATDADKAAGSGSPEPEAGASGAMDLIGFGSGGVVTVAKRASSRSVSAASTPAVQPLPSPAAPAALDDRQLLCLARRDAEAARADLVLTLNSLRGPARESLVGSLLEAAAAFRAFYVEGAETVGDSLSLLQQYMAALAARAPQHRAHDQHVLALKHAAAQALSAALPPRAVSEAALDDIYGRASVLMPGLGADPVLKAGYLRKQASNLARGWQRRYFVLTGTALWYFRDGKPPLPHHVLDVVLCGVKVPAQGKARPELDFTLELISPNKRYYVLQASSASERDRWVAALQQAIARGLAGLQGRGADSPAAPSDEPAAADGSAAAAPASASASTPGAARLAPRDALRKLSRLNATCCDCGASHPDWACINHGTLVCIRCSGVHRALGVHVSKVRSTTLDVWDPELCQFMLSVGNAAFNSIYEAAVPDFMTKPAADAPHEDREEFISLKYARRAFLSKRILAQLVMPQPQLQQALLLAVLYGDLRAMMQLTAVGALATTPSPCPVNVVRGADDDAGGATLLLQHELEGSEAVLVRKGTTTTAVHLAALQGDASCVEFLLQNNSVTAESDSEGFTPAQRAQQAGHVRIVERFQR